MDDPGFSFGSWVKERRKSLGMTRADLANQVPCSVDTINKIERHLRRPSVQMAVRLAKCLHIQDEGQQAWLKLSRLPLLSSKQDYWLEQLLPPCNFDLPQTSLIGREAEIATIKKHLVQGQTSLLTLVGPPGVGKTRLGLQAAYTMRPYFEDGVFWVSLAALEDPQLLMETIMQTLGVDGSSRQVALDVVSDYLREQQILLVLDNFEHICEAAPQVCKLLERCRILKVLVTSRLALRVRPERQLQIKPLAVPGSMTNISLTQLFTHSAVALFSERAQAVNSDFRITQANCSDVVGILQRVDGLPLAIELIAAKMKVITPDDVFAQLRGRFLLTSDGWQDSEERQRTLQNAIEWSFRLLDGPGRSLFACLGIFSGGWTLGAAKIVCQEVDESSLWEKASARILDLISALVQHNLVEMHPQEDGESRYMMLETIRQYALSRLQQSSQLPRMRQRHSDYFMAQIEAAQEFFFSSPESLSWVEVELNNFRAALRRSLEDHRPVTAARLAIALTHFWSIHNRYLSEGRQWMDRLLDASYFQDLPFSNQARLLNSAGTLAYLQGSYQEAQAFQQRALKLADQLDDRVLRAQALFGCSNAAMNLGEYHRVLELLEVCLPLSRQIGDRWLTGMSLNNLAEVARLQGNYEQAQAMFEEGLGLVSQLNAKGFMAILLDGLGTMAQYRSDYQRALTIHTRSLRLACEVDDRRVLALALEKLAGVFANLGFPERAATILGAAEAQRRQIAVPVELIDIPDYDRILAFTRQCLGEEQLKAAWEEGSHMALDEAIAFAVGETS